MIHGETPGMTKEEVFRDLWPPIKYLTVKQLKRCLEGLSDEMRLYHNQVQNLAIRDATGRFLGYIDFLGEGDVEMCDGGTGD